MARLSTGQLTQLLSDAIHATVVIIVVVCTTVLMAATRTLPQDVAGAVFGGAIGYAAGRAGNVQRTQSGRRVEDEE